MAKMIIGKVVGDGAYDIAVKNGYTGTEAEWLAELHGKDGAAGFAPTVTVTTDTATEYVLEITTETETITTPNLKGADGAAGGEVASVNGEVGDVVLTAENIYLTDSEGLQTETIAQALLLKQDNLSEDQLLAIENVAIKADATYVDTALATKVDIVEGKGLSTNDYTTEEKTKLESLENYDDTEVKAQIAEKANSADLAEVATTGDYNDLLNTPTIPSTDDFVTNQQLITKLEDKQDVLTAGANVSISEEGVISAWGEGGGGGGDAVWGSIAGDINSQADLRLKLETKQDVLTAGTNITISNGVISATGGSGEAYDDTEVRQLIANNATAISEKADASELATVATSGDYADLTNQPAIPSIDGLATSQEVTDGLATKQDSLTTEQLANLDAVYAEVATSGSYNDLTDTPTIPSIDGLATEQALTDGLDTKQNTLTAGANITITAGGVISASVEGGGGDATWGSIAGEITNQADLQESLDAKQDVLVSGTDIKTLNGESLLGSGDITIEAGEFVYTNAEPTVIEVGGIKIGTTFDAVPLTKLFGDMFYPELFPSFTNPTSTFVDNVATIVEVGTTTPISFTTTFSRGSISPAYKTSGFRSGPAAEYIYTGPGLTTVEKADNTDIQVVTFTPTEAGATSWTSRVRYLEGEQPLSSKDNNYNSPLVAGMTPVDTITINAVYAMYATEDAISAVNKLALSTANSVEIEMAGESETEKQTLDVYNKEVSKIEVFNDLTKEWDLQDLTAFAKSEITHDTLTYNRYTHTGGKIGARTIKFTF